MAILEIDCTQARISAGIRVAECRRFAGLCVEAARPFAPDELVYRYPLQLIGEDTDVRFITDLGVRACNIEDHGVEISPALLEDLDSETRARLGSRAGADPSDVEELFSRLTDGGHRRFVLGFDDLLNHSDAPNCRFMLSVGAGEREAAQPIAWGELIAQAWIAPGAELTLDYRTFYGLEWGPPATWVP